MTVIGPKFDPVNGFTGAPLEWLNAAYAAWKGARPGGRMVWLGDSLTQGQDASTPANVGESAIQHSQRVSLGNLGSIFSGQRALYVNNAGIGGNTTAQMIARFATDVATYAPNVVHLLAGTNDIGTSVPLATYMANIATLIGKIRAIGATPMLGLMPPSNANPSGIATWNIALRRYALAEGISLVDYYTPLVDPANGQYKSTYYNDGTHPNDAGFVLMAQAFAAVAATVLPPATPPLPAANAANANLINDGMFSALSSFTGAATNGTLVAASSPALGNWLQLAATGTAKTAYQNLATAPVAGHRYAFTGRIQTEWTSGANGMLIRNRITAGGSVDMMPFNNLGVAIADGVFYCEYTCPAAATAQQVLFQVNASVTATLRVAQVGLYDLTALGIA